MDKFLYLLFKVKFLFKWFIYLDYYVRRIKTNSFKKLIQTRFELTDNKEQIIMHYPDWDCKIIVAFYKQGFRQYELLNHLT